MAHARQRSALRATIGITCKLRPVRIGSSSEEANCKDDQNGPRYERYFGGRVLYSSIPLFF